MSNVGFKGFAKPGKVENADDMLGNVAADEYVYYSGGKYGRRRASGRSACLATVTEVKKPVALTDYVKRGFKAGPDGKGFDTSISVGGLSLHQVAKPTVYFYLVKDAEGNFRAKRDIPNPDTAISAKPIAAGDIVIKAKGKAIAKPAGKDIA